jgi:hypothetical protein
MTPNGKRPDGWTPLGEDRDPIREEEVRAKAAELYDAYREGLLPEEAKRRAKLLGHGRFDWPWFALGLIAFYLIACVLLLLITYLIS